MLPLKDHNPSRSVPVVTWLLIGINLYAFWLELTSADIDDFLNKYGLIAARLDFADFSTLAPLFTSMFLHAGWFHLISNMWFLYIFGDNVEDRLGKIKYLFFYFVSGLTASLAQYLTNAVSDIPMIGASGAVAGVLGAYLLFFPTHRVDTLVPLFFFIKIVPLPAMLTIGYWFVTQLFAGIGSLAVPTAATGGIAFFAHIGGFITGGILALLLKNKIKPAW